MTFDIINILKILNWSPLLHTSNDDNFDSIDNLTTARTFIIGASPSPIQDKDRI